MHQSTTWPFLKKLYFYCVQVNIYFLNIVVFNETRHMCMSSLLWRYFSQIYDQGRAKKAVEDFWDDLVSRHLSVLCEKVTSSTDICTTPILLLIIKLSEFQMHRGSEDTSLFKDKRLQYTTKFIDWHILTSLIRVSLIFLILLHFHHIFLFIRIIASHISFESLKFLLSTFNTYSWFLLPMHAIYIPSISCDAHVYDDVIIFSFLGGSTIHRGRDRECDCEGEALMASIFAQGTCAAKVNVTIRYTTSHYKSFEDDLLL